MKKCLFIKGLLLSLVCIAFLCLDKSVAKAEEQNKWNMAEPTVVAENGITYDVCFSNDRTECWIVKVTMPEGSTTLKFPKVLQNATVTKLGSNKTENIFGQEVHHLDEFGQIIYRKNSKSLYPIKKLSIPDTVTEITGGTFGFFYKLKNVRLPDNLKKITDGIFYWCDNLESIVFPENLEMIVPVVCLESNKIKKISISKENPTYQVKDNYLINKKTKKLEFFATVKKKIKIPKGVKIIGREVALCAGNATSLHIPKSVTRIEDWALDMDTSLKKITIQKGNKKYAVHDNCIYHKKDKSLVAVIVKKGKIKISPKVRSIGAKVDVIGKNIKTIHIPASVKKVYNNWSEVLCKGEDNYREECKIKFYFYGKKPPKFIVKLSPSQIYGNKVYVPKKWKKNYKNICDDKDHLRTFNPK